MQKISCLILFIVIALSPTIAQAQRKALAQSIEKRSDESWEMAKKIWKWAEPGYQESKSAKLLSECLEKAGFTVKRGVAEIPTAFTATFGEGEPVIGILGEYDALPGLSQEAVPFRKVDESRTYGHACGHHLFGVGSMSACIALAEQIKAGNIKGTIRFYGCPAEEGGAAKVFMARAGLFKDCDVALHWHPSSQNSAGDRSCLARIAAKYRFHGKSAHAAGSPELGRSALDAVELTNHATQLLREHTPDFTRIHHVITAGGDAPNVVPNFAEVYYYVRHPESDVVTKLYPRLLKCAQAGALATETELKEIYLGGTKELLPNNVLGALALKNLRELNDIKYTEEEQKFALRLQETLARKLPLSDAAKIYDVTGTVNKGSTDVGDVSWVVPTTGFTTTCWVPGTSAHSWQAVAAGGMGIGRKGMQLAAKTLAVTAWDLYQDPKLIAASKAEHERRTKGKPYKAMLLKGQKPPLDYRNPPKRK